MGIFARALTQPAHQFAHQNTRIFFNWWFNWSASYMIDYVLWNESFCKGVVSYRLPTRLKLGYFLNYVLCRARNGFHFGSFLFFFFSFISFFLLFFFCKYIFVLETLINNYSFPFCSMYVCLKFKTHFHINFCFSMHNTCTIVLRTDNLFISLPLSLFICLWFKCQASQHVRHDFRNFLIFWNVLSSTFSKYKGRFTWGFQKLYHRDYDMCDMSQQGIICM